MRLLLRQRAPRRAAADHGQHERERAAVGEYRAEADRGGVAEGGGGGGEEGGVVEEEVEEGGAGGGGGAEEDAMVFSPFFFWLACLTPCAKERGLIGRAPFLRMSRVCEQWSLDNLVDMDEQDMEALLGFYAPGTVPTFEQIRIGGDDADGVGFDGSFGWWIG